MMVLERFTEGYTLSQYLARNPPTQVRDDILHKISRKIVNEALENDSIIVLGNLKGMRRNDKGRRFNGKLNNGFPYYRLSQFIEYKAKWLRIKIIKLSKKNTSKLCHRCGHKELRIGSLFKCPNCNYSCNADYNGVMNILKRGMGYMPMLGAGLTQPELSMMKPQAEKPRISLLK